jgi:hypothetical protein
MVARILGCFVQGLDNMGRRWKVRVPYPKVDNVYSFGPNLFFLSIDLFEKIRRKTLQPLSFFDFQLSPSRKDYDFRQDLQDKQDKRFT